RLAVRRSEAELTPTVPVVADVRRHALHRAAATVEVVDTEGEDLRPTRVEPGVEVQRLEVTDLLPEIVGGFVTGRPDTARLEEQRSELEAALDVRQEGTDVGAARAPLVTVAELVVEGRVQRERSRAPARVDTDRVPALCSRSHRTLRVGDGPPRRGAGRAVSVEVRVQRLDVEPLERRDLGADDDREVITAPVGGGASQPVAPRDLVLDLNVRERQVEVRRERRPRRDTREVAVGVRD